METQEILMKDLLDSIPQKGTVTWIGLRPARDQATKVVDQATAEIGQGLQGDRFSGRPESKRQVTLIQEEHLAVIGLILNKEIDPSLLRRNILVKGINLLSLHNRQFRIGEIILEGTGYCYPCSRMETALGEGGYNAMRGHGGITARIIQGGTIKVGNQVSLITG